MTRRALYLASGVGHAVLLAVLGTIQPPVAEAALQTVTLVEVPVVAPEVKPEPEPQPEPEPKPEPEPELEPEPKPAPAPKPKAAPAPRSVQPSAKPAATARPASAVPAVPAAAGRGADAPVVDVPEFASDSAPSRADGPATSDPAPKKPAPPAEPEGGCDEPLVKAEPLDVPEPAFTAEARAEGIAGRVRLTLQIDAKGKVTSAKVTDGLGFGLDDAALAAARAARFKPATRCGEPVASTFKLSIQFSP